MKIEFSGRSSQNLTALMRSVGYTLPARLEPHKKSFIRRLSRADYPHFHIYIDEMSDSKTLMNLHLDQKAPSYTGTAAHAGEYNGPAVEAEAAFIKQQLQSSFI